MIPVNLHELGVEDEIAVASRLLRESPAGFVLRFWLTEQFVAGVQVERAFLARTDVKAREIVEACDVLGIELETVASEPDDGFFYLRFSDENEDLVYTELPKARVLSILRGNLDDEEYAKALKWLNSERLEAFASGNDNLLVS